MWKNTRNVFYKTRAVRNTYSKGNIDRSNSALAATDKIYVCGVRNTYLKGNIDHSKSALAEWGKTPELFSTKGVRFVIPT